MELKAEYVNHGNDDLTVVNAARVSFDKESKWGFEHEAIDVEDGGGLETVGKHLPANDVKLIKYLASHNHWTPFSHCRFTFVGFSRILNSVPFESELRTGLVFTPDLKKVRHSFFGWFQLLQTNYIDAGFRQSLINYLCSLMPVSSEAYDLKPNGVIESKIHLFVEEETDERFIDHTLRETVPIFVARQRFKHTVDIDYNEVSRRYVSDTPEFYWPDVWRGAPTGGAKQGSSGGLAHSENELCNIELRAHENASVKLYETLLKRGVAPEQARMVLPQSMMTSYYVTGSLISWKRSFGLRIDAHAQKEIRDLAVQWGQLIEGLQS